MKIENELEIYEVDGKEIDFDRPTLLVKSHWNQNSKVVLEFQGKVITVLTTELAKAITNACNTGKY